MGKTLSVLLVICGLMGLLVGVILLDGACKESALRMSIINYQGELLKYRCELIKCRDANSQLADERDLLMQELNLYVPVNDQYASN